MPGLCDKYRNLLAHFEPLVALTYVTEVAVYPLLLADKMLSKGLEKNLQ